MRRTTATQTQQIAVIDHFFISIYTQTKIYVDLNEDGFNGNHVKAFCIIGESTKENVQDYIGEKGIGFKSVFKVAKRVHIQFGPFSFSFTHSQSSDEDGLGMVTPYNELLLPLPDGVQTRITLTPRVESSFEQRVQDIEALPDTFLLFLWKLETIKISVYPLFSGPKLTKYSFTSTPETNIKVIVKEVTETNQVQRTENKFHVIRKIIQDLPEDTARPEFQSAEVVLAFPVDEEENPVQIQQYTYAYLPLRNLGFNASLDH
jgi:hypothetical protein